jgi:hypothetical protein
VWTSARTNNVNPAWASTHGLRNLAMVAVSGSPRDGWTTLRWGSEVLDAAVPG